MKNLINEILKRNKTKSDMSYLIHKMDFQNVYGASYYVCYNKKEDIKNELIKLLNTDKIFKLKTLSTLLDLFENFDATKLKEQNLENLKSFEAEIYTICPISGKMGWDIKIIRTLAENKTDAKENFKKYTLFDCIILWNQVNGLPNNLDLELITKDNLYYFS